jgi:integrase
MTRKARGTGSVYQRGRVWWAQYCHQGKVMRESSGSSSRAEAVRLLKKRLGEIGHGRLIGPDVERTTFEDLARMLTDDYRVNGRRSLYAAKRALAHLREVFGLSRAVEITEDRIAAYVVKRQSEGAANATINRELAALKRAFRLGERAQKVARRPYVAMLQERNTRKGFLEPEQFRAVADRLSDDLRPVVEAAYIMGWRVASEILTRQWKHVDFEVGLLRLEPGETKNGEGRQFPLTTGLRAVLERQRERTTALEQAQGRIIPWVFHRNGEPIRDLRIAWNKACREACVPGKLLHDFRRTAVRNLERAGVPRSTAMALVGHKTESIYRRYAITDEAMLREGAEKLSRLHEASGANEGTSHVADGRSVTELTQSRPRPVERHLGRAAQPAR